LFEKFASRSDGGTGLGLFLSKRIISAHGGNIWGSNNPTGGAVFSFTLPSDLQLFKDESLNFARDHDIESTLKGEERK
jgi:signal transduction histidine kinase